MTTAANAAASNAAVAGEGAELRLADHFPRVDKSCKKPAAKFFNCFSEKANQPPEGVSLLLCCIPLLYSVHLYGNAVHCCAVLP